MTKIKNELTNVLADRWSPPPEVITGNVGYPLVCIATTYTFHASFFETELLPRFLRLKYDQAENIRPFIIEREQALATSRVSILVDSSHIDRHQSTLRWDQLPVRVPSGLQHSKIVLLVWENFIRLIISSANLTRQGYRRNREIAGILDFYNERSSSPKKILLDVIKFLNEMADFIRTTQPAVSRYLNGLKDARSKLAGWKKIPSEFTKNEKPKVFFIGGLPKREGHDSLSPLDQFIKLWDKRKADEIIVMTPFVGDADKNIDAVIKRLMRIPRMRDPEISLVVPGKPSVNDEKKLNVALPERFLKAWADTWRIKKQEVGTYIVPPYRNKLEKEVNRALHAKAVYIANNDIIMLLSGSSNFSQHGMGIIRYNIEANLCYVDKRDEKRGGKYLYDRLPVIWETDWYVNASWLKNPDPIEDELDGQNIPIPSVFLWASYNQRAGKLEIGIDRDKKFPREWTIYLTGHDTDKDILVNHFNYGLYIQEDKIIIILPEHLREVNVISLNISWCDEKGVWYKTLILVSVESGESILPPEEFRAMSVNSIIECLYAGKEASELLDSFDIEENKKKQIALPPEIDSLHAVDTSGYLLYKMRRIGKAISALGVKLISSAYSAEALNYRLRQDPLGPLMFAESLMREWQEKQNSGAVKESSNMTLLCLAELYLMLVHVSKKFHKKQHRMLFVKTMHDIDQLIKEIKAGYNIPMNFNRYLKECREVANASTRLRK